MVPVLTYHGYNIAGNDYHNNDHIALAADLEWLATEGWTCAPLHWVVESFFEGKYRAFPDRCVALTFDDGTDLDWLDVDSGASGQHRSFAGILRDWNQKHPHLAPAHATSFVIASPAARKILAEKALSRGHGMNSSWWSQAINSGLMTLGNHSWDHRHPLVVPEVGGTFFSVADERQADLQVRQAGEWIAQRSGRWPALFAYPWGQASDYLRVEYFPRERAAHRCSAAFGTEPGILHPGCDRWYLPRFVCGQHWRSPDELKHLLH